MPKKRKNQQNYETHFGPRDESSPELEKYKFMFQYDIPSMAIFKRNNRKYDPNAPCPEKLKTRFREVNK